MGLSNKLSQSAHITLNRLEILHLNERYDPMTYDPVISCHYSTYYPHKQYFYYFLIISTPLSYKISTFIMLK